MSSQLSDFDIAAEISHVRPLVTLEKKVAPTHTAVIVIDMQNDFCSDEGLVAKGGRDVSAAQELAMRMPNLIEAARGAGVLIVFVRNVSTSENNKYLSDVWLEQAARKQGGEKLLVIAPFIILIEFRELLDNTSHGLTGLNGVCFHKGHKESEIHRHGLVVFKANAPAANIEPTVLHSFQCVENCHDRPGIMLLKLNCIFCFFSDTRFHLRYEEF